MVPGEMITSRVAEDAISYTVALETTLLKVVKVQITYTEVAATMFMLVVGVMIHTILRPEAATIRSKMALSTMLAKLTC